MRYESEALGVSFELPDTLTVREQLLFRSRIAERPREEHFTRYWYAAQSLIQEWQCDDIPDPAELDMDAPDGDGRLSNIVMWVANTAAGHLAGIDIPPKN